MFCLKFLIKKKKIVTQQPHIFYSLIKKKKNMFKKYAIFHKFTSKSVTKHILFGICHWKIPFLWKISLLTWRPLLFVIFASLNAPCFENRGRTLVPVLYSSAPYLVLSFWWPTWAHRPHCVSVQIFHIWTTNQIYDYWTDSSGSSIKCWNKFF